MNHLHGIFNFETYDFDYVVHNDNHFINLEKELIDKESVLLQEHPNQTFLEF